MSDKNYIDISQLQIRVICSSDYNLIKNFKCGNSSLENFLKQEAYYSTISKQATTNLIFYEDELVGYFTLKKAKLSIDIDLAPINFPYSLDIARLAVRQDYQDRGIGCSVIKKIVEIANTVNERFITLDALIEKYDWYVHRGFTHLIEEEITESNKHGLVYMIMDLFDETLVDQYFDEAI